MDKLHENMGVYTHSGSAPHVQAARGERTVSIGLDMRAVREKNNGAPLEIVVPTGGVGWDMEATALVKGRPNAAAARKVVDFTVSKERPRALRQDLCDPRPQGGQRGAQELSGQRRGADAQGRLRQDGGRPRPRARRMDQALRRQVGAQELSEDPGA